jgi:hypothetical protein
VKNGVEDPSEDLVEQKARTPFEAEAQKNAFWDEASAKSAGAGPNTPLIVNEADKARYRERARVLVIEVLKAQR